MSLLQYSRSLFLGLVLILGMACGGGGGGGGGDTSGGGGGSVPGPIATSLTAGATSIAVGASTTLTPVFSNGTGVITPGNLPATSGTAITVSPTTTTTYTLTVTNSVGLSATTTATVTVVPAPVATSLTAGAAVITAGTITTLTPVFSNGTGVITPGNLSATSGTAITVSPTTTTTYTLTVTNALGATATTTATVTVVAAPVATSLTAAASAIAVGTSTTLTPVFSNGTGVITPGNLPATSGTAISVSPTTTTTYTLTVSNTGGTIVSITCVITVVPAPVATSLTPQDFSIILGNSTTLTPVFTGGTAKIGTTSGGSQITASAISENPITITPSQTTSYFLTVTNALGAVASTSTTVTVVGAAGPSITNFVASSNSINAGQSTSLTAIFSNGTGVVTGGSSPVSISSGIPIFVAPLSTTTYLLTVSNTAGTSVTKSLTITVTSSSRSLSYIDPTSGTYRLVKNVALSTSNHLVLDLVSTDSQLVSGIGLNIESDNTKVIWVKAASSDATLIQNGNIFNLGSSPQVLYGKVISGTTSSTLSAVIALKGPTGVAINGSGSVLARMALDPLSTGASGVVTLTVNKAQANIQGVSSPSTITVNVGTLTLN